MNNFTWKLWQHLNYRKNANGGFTLIELLVVIIIIGILSAIALPSFLNQTAKAKEVEAINFVKYMNKEQNAHYIEKMNFKQQVTDFNFTPSGLEPYTGPLGAGLSHKTENYLYGVETVSGLGSVDEAALHIGFTENSALRSYLGVVYIEDGQMKKRLCKASMLQLTNIAQQILTLGNIDELESQYCN